MYETKPRTKNDIETILPFPQKMFTAAAATDAAKLRRPKYNLHSTASSIILERMQ